MRIRLEFFEDRVESENTLLFRALTGIDMLELNARDLQIRSVEWLGALADRPAPPRPTIAWADAALALLAKRSQPCAVKWNFEGERNLLAVAAPQRLPHGAVFAVRTRTTCLPSDHILEGIYKDVTPAGCPQQFMSQCQQWGF